MWLEGGGGDCKKRGTKTGASADRLIIDDGEPNLAEALLMSGDMGVIDAEGREGVAGEATEDGMGGGKVKDGEAVGDLVNDGEGTVDEDEDDVSVNEDVVGTSV